MRSRILSVLLGLAMGWTVVGATACASFAPRHENPSRFKDLETPKRMIGVLKKGSTCPTVPGWTTQSLLEIAAAHARDGIKNGACSAPPLLTLEDFKRQEKVATVFHKNGLDRYCVYTDKGEGKVFRKPAGLSKASPDRLGVTASASELGSLGDQTWETLATHFLDQVGGVQLGSATTPTVRLVFVDTHPTGEGPPTKDPAPKSWHGYGMAHLANEIVCGHDTAYQCPVHIATRLAMRYESYHRDYVQDDTGNDLGGHQGRLGDLAAAIVAELNLWSSMNPQPKLILNLSIGWDGEFKFLNDVDKENELEAGTSAVYDALESARKLGVLVIAAAGNRSGGVNSQLPMLPAAWESHPPSWIASLCGKKVAYAVGGVDWQGLPLPNVRPSGLPERVTYADHAVAGIPNGDGILEPTRMYTGSSVSAAVASSIAAVTWRLQPTLTPDQVMKKMTHAGDRLDSTATFYSWKHLVPPHLKRLSLCQTVLSLCGPDVGQNCPGVIAPTPFTCPQDHPPADLSAITTQNSSEATFNPIDPPPACNPKTQVFMEEPDSDSGSDEHKCPVEKLLDMNAPSLTQTLPPETPCSTCTVVPDRPAADNLAGPTPEAVEIPDDESDEPKPYSLAVTLDPDWLAQANTATNHTDISSAILVIDCSTGSPSEERLDLTPQFQTLLLSVQGTTPPPDPVKIGFGAVGDRTTLDGCTASMDFSLLVTTAGIPEPRSVQSPVYVDP